MRRLLALIVLAGGMVAVGGGTAWACSCVGYATEAQRYRAMGENAERVYTGTVLGPYTDGGYDVRVESNLKETSVGTRHVKTAADGASCGISLEPGRVFLVESGGGNTGLCSGTTQEDVDGAVADYEMYNGVRARPAPLAPIVAGPSLPRTGASVPALATATLLAAALGFVLRRAAGNIPQP